MDVREKLVELLENHCAVIGEDHCKASQSGECTPRDCAICLASDLIAKGVTVQEWIPVTERLPEPETDVIAFVGGYIEILSYSYDRRGNLAFMYMDDSGRWHERIRPSVTHWQPLPQPPKGE